MRRGCKGQYFIFNEENRFWLLNPEGPAFTAVPCPVERAIKCVEGALVHDTELDGFSVGGGWVAFLGHFIGLGSGPRLGAIAEFFGAFLEAGQGIELGVLGDGFHEVKAGEGRSRGVHGDFRHEEGAIEDVGMFADGGDVAEVYRVFSTGEAGFPAALFVLLVFEALLLGLFGLFGLSGFVVVLLARGVLSVQRGKSEGEGEERDVGFHSERVISA
jgi:hypothetical protein